MNPQPDRYERPALTIELRAPPAAGGRPARGSVSFQLEGAMVKGPEKEPAGPFHFAGSLFRRRRKQVAGRRRNTKNPATNIPLSSAGPNQEIGLAGSAIVIYGRKAQSSLNRFSVAPFYEDVTYIFIILLTTLPLMSKNILVFCW